jgi:hypothetical protein
VGESFRSYGTRIGLRVSEAGALPRMLERLPPGWQEQRRPTVDRLYSLVVGGKADGHVRRLNLLYRDAELLARTRHLDEALDTFAADVQLHVAEHAKQRVFVHAGAVGWRGRAIVLPGRSFSGKTTMVEHLVRAGATYYSDDYAVFDARGRLHPFPRQLSIRRNGAHTQERHSVESLGGSAGEQALPVGLVVVTEYSAGVRGWRPRTLSPGQGVLELVSHAVAARRRPEAVLEALHHVIADAPVLKGRRGEAEHVAALILERAS